MGRPSPSRHDDLQHKLFVGGISNKFRDSDLKKAFQLYGAIRATVMIDRKTHRSRGFGFVYLDHNDSLRDAITEMHGAVLDGRKISVTRAVPETQTAPGTPAPLLAAGKGMRGGRGGRGGARDPADGSPRAGRAGRSKRYERGVRDKAGGSAGRSRRRSPSDRYHRGHSRDHSRSISIDRQSSGSTDSHRSSHHPQASPPYFPPYESAAVAERNSESCYESGFQEYMHKSKPLNMRGWIVADAEEAGSPVSSRRRKSSRYVCMDRMDSERGARTKQLSMSHDIASCGPGGLRGSARPRDRPSGREQMANIRGHPERYSRALR